MIFSFLRYNDSVKDYRGLSSLSSSIDSFLESNNSDYSDSEENLMLGNLKQMQEHIIEYK